MPALPSRKKRKLAAAARLTQTDLDEIAAPANGSAHTNKYNLQYEPDDPTLSEEQRAEWRKEQRKARNRASAAASRLKTRARIDELEGEVSELKRMYAAAVERIAELEGTTASTAAGSLSIDMGMGMGNGSTPARVTSTTISPPSSPPPQGDHDDLDALPMPPLDLEVHESSPPPSTSMFAYSEHGQDQHQHQHHRDDTHATTIHHDAEKQHVIETTSLPAA